MQTITFRTATVTMDEWNIWSTFHDGKVNHFWIPGNLERPEYLEAVALYGYGNDARRYSIEHELAHHFLADNMGMRYSWSLHSAAGRKAGDFGEKWPNHIEWEENLVNAFQAYYAAGKPDPWNTLHCVFNPSKLDELCEDFADLNTFRKRYNKITYEHQEKRFRLNEHILPT